MDTLQILTLALGAAWASGINLYATVLLLGGLGLFGVVDLPSDLEVLESPWVLVAAAVMYLMEFLADKIPGVDSIWDGFHTFIRIPAGAALAAGAVGGLDGWMGDGTLGELANEAEVITAMLAGGVVAAGSHAAKAGTRAVANTSPEPFSNWFLSVAEDILVFLGLGLALAKPVFFLIGFGVFALLLLWLLPKIWRGIRSIFGSVRHPGEGMRQARATAGAAAKGAKSASKLRLSGPYDPGDGRDGSDGDARFM